MDLGRDRRQARRATDGVVALDLAGGDHLHWDVSLDIVVPIFLHESVYEL
jgi:hypothetical protein